MPALKNIPLTFKINFCDNKINHIIIKKRNKAVFFFKIYILSESEWIALQKKMKEWIPGMICLALFHLSCEAHTRQRESMIGLNCTEMVQALGLGLDLHHSINSKWSISAGILLYPHKYMEIYNEEEKSHYEEFEAGAPFLNQEEDKKYISLHFWTGGVFKGAEFGCGIIHSRGSTPKMAVEAGYYARIRKRMALGFIFKTTILKKNTERSFNDRELHITLNCIF